jgi:hypothetical protein
VEITLPGVTVILDVISEGGYFNEGVVTLMITKRFVVVIEVSQELVGTGKRIS